jgi:hypothetical protein
MFNTKKPKTETLPDASTTPTICVNITNDTTNDINDPSLNVSVNIA